MTKVEVGGTTFPSWVRKYIIPVFVLAFAAVLLAMHPPRMSNAEAAAHAAVMADKQTGLCREPASCLGAFFVRKDNRHVYRVENCGGSCSFYSVDVIRFRDHMFPAEPQGIETIVPYQETGLWQELALRHATQYVEKR